MLSETTYGTLASFATGTLDDDGWQRLWAEAQGNAELRQAIVDLASLRATLTNGDMRREYLDSLETSGGDDDERFVRRLLEEHWPDDYAFAGQALVAEILAGTSQFEAPRHGRLMDLGHARKVLVEGVRFIRACLELLPMLTARAGQTPSSHELADQAAASSGAVELDADTRRSIADEVRQWRMK
jgi:hypothetical protein